MEKTVTLAEYLFTRLQQLGVQSIHGVPGDYNLNLLDYIEPQGLHWVGNCNELNAGYAADGYARVKGTIGALITTFGVGELSAANAVAGAYAELAPVVHIVGTPARHLHESRARIHHTFNDGNYERFAEMHARITVAQANLTDPRTCPAMIDATLQQCLIHSRPVYIRVPVDMVAAPVHAERLATRVTLPPSVPSNTKGEAVSVVLERMYASKRPMILVDGESRAYGIVDELHDLIRRTQWPTWTSVFGKSIVDESLPTCRGVWKGAWAAPEDTELIDARDLVLCFGGHFSGTNTFGYSSIPDAAITVHVQQFGVKTPTQTFRDLPSKDVLRALLARLDPTRLQPVHPTPALKDTPMPTLDPRGIIDQASFYRVLNTVFRDGDVILAETGTAAHGCRDFRLPSGTHLLTPATWLSIGYMLPAAQGAALAQRERHVSHEWSHGGCPPRTILITGDGSFQMTAQELSTIIRTQLPVTIVLINNDGYTIERCLHGRKQAYNDIAAWRYLDAPAFFGGGKSSDADYSIQTFRVETWGDLDRVLHDQNMTTGNGLRMVEVVMGREDAPPGSLLESLQEQQRNSI